MSSGFVLEEPVEQPLYYEQQYDIAWTEKLLQPMIEAERYFITGKVKES